MSQKNLVTVLGILLASVFGLFVAVFVYAYKSDQAATNSKIEYLEDSTNSKIERLEKTLKNWRQNAEQQKSPSIARGAFSVANLFRLFFLILYQMVVLKT